MNASRFRLQAKLLRRELRRIAQMLRYRRSLNDLPILFANSFPKSGTHLLTQVLQGFTHLGAAVDSGLPAIVMYEGSTGKLRPVETIRSDLERLRPGGIAYGHLHALPEIIAYLCQDGFAPYFILRDPRDVAVSHVHYVTEMATDHIHHDYYAGTLQTFDDRLTTSILGRPGWEALFPDIRARFEPYLDWLDQPEVLTLRYEDFISNRVGALEQVLDHALSRGFSIHCDRREAVEVLEQNIAPERSPTFREGRAGGWRESFQTEHIKLFKQVAGDLLIRLGYEHDSDW